MDSNSIITIDEMDMFYREDFYVTDNICIKSPTIVEIKDYGESKYWSAVNTFTSRPCDMKSSLWDAGIDYTKISDFDLFITMSRGLDKDYSYILFGDIDFSKMIVKQSEDGRIYLEDEDNGYIVDEFVYQKIVAYIRAVHGIVPKVEIPANEFTKMALIEEDRELTMIRKRKNTSAHSVILPMIITCCNTEEFKYNSRQVLGIGLYELTESFRQIQSKKATCALISGMYSGMIDTSKFHNEDFDWTWKFPD